MNKKGNKSCNVSIQAKIKKKRGEDEISNLKYSFKKKTPEASKRVRSKTHELARKTKQYTGDIYKTNVMGLLWALSRVRKMFYEYAFGDVLFSTYKALKLTKIRLIFNIFRNVPNKFVETCFTVYLNLGLLYL